MTITPTRTTDPRIHFSRAVDLAMTVVANVTPDRLGDPTPCPEYDVGTMIGHMVTVLRRVEALGRGDDPFGMPPSPLVADDGWLEAFADAAYDARAAWADDAVLASTMRLPWMEGPGAQVLTSYVNEITVHTWDLATATGQGPVWDPQILALAFDGIRFLPATGRAELMAPFADAVPVPEDAPLIDRLVAWNGRRPARRLERAPTGIAWNGRRPA